MALGLFLIYTLAIIFFSRFPQLTFTLGHLVARL